VLGKLGIPTHKVDSQPERFVIQGRRRGICYGSRSLLTECGAIRTAGCAAAERYWLGKDFNVVPLSIDREGVPPVKRFYQEPGLEKLRSFSPMQWWPP
jgi:hypothetical protein